MIARLLPLAAGIAMAIAAVSLAAAQSPNEYCQSNFDKLKAGLDKYGKAIQTANKRKANVVEACGLFKSYVAAESRMIDFVKKAQTTCGIPNEVLSNLAKAHAKSTDIRTKVCNAAASGSARTPSSGLSSALGLSSAAPAPDDKPSGVFDTLNGNVLR